LSDLVISSPILVFAFTDLGVAMQIGLGTVQWGKAYGISNAMGRTPPSEVARILKEAESNGVAVLDTAPAYGSAEMVLGRTLEPGHGFRIVTKTASINGTAVDDDALAHVRATFMRSLDRLRSESVAGLLVHDTADLLATGGERLAELLLELKSAGLVEKIGFSVYSPEDIDRAQEVLQPDLLQAPLNVLDQRLLVGSRLQRLQDAGIEVHIRSVFLQGLLVMGSPSSRIKAAAVTDALVAVREKADCLGITVSGLALLFAMQNVGRATVLLGVNDHAQLQ
jgi:aryl-alcohol dehydrogenase-like predicted oxidoreductase